jgi:hypothetical protein
MCSVAQRATGRRPATTVPASAALVLFRLSREVLIEPRGLVNTCWWPVSVGRSQRPSGPALPRNAPRAKTDVCGMWSR